MTSKELFYEITSTDKEIDFQKYKINSDIVKSRDDLCKWWFYELDDGEKNKFTKLELNLIIWFIGNRESPRYENKPKSELLGRIKYDVRWYLTQPAYDKIVTCTHLKHNKKRREK